MEKDFAAISDIVDRMLLLLKPESYSVDRTDGLVDVRVAGAGFIFNERGRIVLGDFDLLGRAIETQIAFERTLSMLKAAYPKPPSDTTFPLWMVRGSHVLAHWLRWSRTENALRRELVLHTIYVAGPLAGLLDRRARRDIGQARARIRVRFSEAVAEEIELAEKPRVIAKLGETAQIRVERHALPETFIQALNNDEPGSNIGLRLSDVIDHPFFQEAEFRVIDVRNENRDVIFDIETRWEPLQPVPAAALAAVPRDADPAAPWKATASEMRKLDRLIEEGRRHSAA